MHHHAEALTMQGKVLMLPSMHPTHLSEVDMRAEAGSSRVRAHSKGDASMSLLVARRSCD
jgi:hypothetical protein